MEPIPARLLRAEAERCKSRPPKTLREQRAYDFILEAAQNMFLLYGRSRVTIAGLAIATSFSELTIRRQILDLHNLFRIILAQHLDRIVKAISEVPRSAPDPLASRRAAYYRATRGFTNVPTQMHFLLLQDRYTLPADQLEPLEQIRATIGYILGGDDWEATLRTLDCPNTDLATAEVMLAAREEYLRRRNEAPKIQPVFETAPEPEPYRPKITTVAPFKSSDIKSPLADLTDAELRALTPASPRPRKGPPPPLNKAALLATAARAGPN